MRTIAASLSCLGLILFAECAPAQSAPVLGVQMIGGHAYLSVTGEIGAGCTIQFRNNTSATNIWQFFTNIARLATSPMVIADLKDGSPQRLYRAFCVQTPTNVMPIPKMVWIPAGTFLMGSPTSESMRIPGGFETLHPVTLTRGFYMGQFEVTQGQYLSLIGTNPSYFTPAKGYPQDLSLPVEQISYTNATNFCATLTQQEIVAGHLPAGWAYRLPTEAEWEYACRAGTTTASPYGNLILASIANFDGYKNYDASSQSWVGGGPALARTTSVGSYQANPWGLYDMCGNVAEWCCDWLPHDYPTEAVTDPHGTGIGVRGGCWHDGGEFCRAAARYSWYAYGNFNYNGFRMVLAPVVQ